ncbi:MAG: DUF58 domain-containing protein [Haloarculaceae archaeon]
MYPTRRAATVGLAAAALAGLALLLARPALLYAAAGLLGWLLVASADLLRETRRLDRALSVEEDVDPGTVVTDDPVTVTLEVSLAAASPLSLRVRADPPVAARVEGEPTASLPAGGTDAATTFTVRVGVAGRHEFGRPTVEVTGPRGLFRTTRRLESGLTLAVDPRAPRNVHVGTGGEEVATAFGEHEAGRLGSGLDPAELREYHPGDAAGRIDWKATARLASPYVREFEAETDRTTALLVDHRDSTATGRPGERELDFLREVALAFLASARALSDPLGCYAVGDGGATAVHPPGTTATAYTTVRRTLEALEPTESEGELGGDGGGPLGGRAGRSPSDARRAAATLAGDDSAFGRRLRPLFEAADPYVDRVTEDPLFATARTRLTRLRGTTWTVLLTDDARPTEVRETVKVARRGSGRCLVFLAPTVLFEPGGLADLEAAYGRYLEFEGFRRELAALDRVRAFEVAPGDRIGALLADRRRRGTGTTVEVSR